MPNAEAADMMLRRLQRDRELHTMELEAAERRGAAAERSRIRRGLLEWEAAQRTPPQSIGAQPRPFNLNLRGESLRRAIDRIVPADKTPESGR